MNFKRLSSLFCLSSSLVCCNLNNPASANMEGRVATKSDIDTIVTQNLVPLGQKVLEKSILMKQTCLLSSADYMTILSDNAYEFYSKKNLSDFSKISNELCKGLSELKYLDCLTVSTYFSDLLTKKGIQNTVVYFPCYKGANGSKSSNGVSQYSMHALVIYAYNDGKNSSYVFADPYNFLEKCGKTENAETKLHMSVYETLSNFVGSYDNWALSDNEKSPKPIPLFNWITTAAEKNKINVDKYNEIANGNFNYSNNFKTLIRKRSGHSKKIKWMIDNNSEKIDSDRPFKQKPSVKIDGVTPEEYALALALIRSENIDNKNK